MSPKYVCIHGHFYQPPRDNAWLEAVEMQESAYPDHDWNERISRECYETNAKARLLNAEGWIKSIVNNYERINFNFGPTLLAWMQGYAPACYAEIIRGDALSIERFGGHGSAMAQGYGHTILPLNNDRDRLTQVRWGVRDFEHRFGRKPEGMWMPETAVSTPTLEALAEAGIRFTIMAPRQCAAVRPIGGEQWTELDGSVDPTRAYQIALPSGRSISAFFYDGPVSQGVAFEGLLNSGDRFADRILSGFSDKREHAQIMHIATDGESYGHHHRHGEMALAAALERIENDPQVELTNYGLYLERHPPQWEARIHENSSWSCVHGIERWRSDCGCNSGRQGFHQRWRGPLREAFDFLRDTVAPVFEERAREFFKDPWAAREDYIGVILDRSPESIDRFLAAHRGRDLAGDDRSRALMLMELQRHAMLMYTSCAWFFDDVAGIENVQVIQYAARVVQLARLTLGLELENEFLTRLERAEGSMKEYPNGRSVYEKIVRPAMLDLNRVGAHYALARIFEDVSGPVYAYDVEPGNEKRLTAGKARLLTGHAVFNSRVTLERSHLSYVAVHFGDHTASCGVRAFEGEDAFQRLSASLDHEFETADFAAVIRAIDREFSDRSYNIGSLFRDQQHAVVRKILEPTLQQIDASYQAIYDQHAPMVRFLRSLDLTVPRRIQIVGSFVLSQSIRRLLEQPPFDRQRAGELVAEAEKEGVELDAATIGHAVRIAMNRLNAAASSDADDMPTLQSMLHLATFTASLPFEVDTWPLQEMLLRNFFPRAASFRERAAESPEAREWVEALEQLGGVLRVVV